MIAQEHPDHGWLQELSHNPLLVGLVVFAIIAVAIVLVKVGPAMLEARRGKKITGGTFVTAQALGGLKQAALSGVRKDAAHELELKNLSVRVQKIESYLARHQAKQKRRQK